MLLLKFFYSRKHNEKNTSLKSFKPKRERTISAIQMTLKQSLSLNEIQLITLPINRKTLKTKDMISGRETY